MNPRLVILGGPSEGRIFPLSGDRFTLGRQADNDLQLASLEVSRRHCELRPDGEGGWTVHDLDSRHGVFVNGRPVRERRLAHSDLLTVGATALLFLVDDSAASGVTAAASGGEIPWSSGSTLLRKPTEILYRDPARLDAALPAQARLARDLHALLRISTALQGPLPLDRLGKRLLEALLEIVPAERAAVLLSEPGTDELTPVAVHLGAEADTPAEAGFRVGRSVLETVLRDKVSLAWSRDEADASKSLSGLRSLLSAPLLSHDGEVLGVLYGDSRERSFDEDHLELAGAVAGIASLALENALHLRWLEGENRRLREHQLEHDLVGESAPLRRLLDLIARVAKTDTTVLLRGESGTGKELAAQAIHRSSPRAGGPFVAVNCATLSETLLESDLFGHEKGAFTGAVERKIGRFEAARGGTLFLDEVAEIPPKLQARLLRVLQERELVRVGGTRPIPTDVRVVAATHRDLEAEIRGGGFREDLYYRLKVIALELPPLRARREDVPLLTAHFAALHARRLGRRPPAVSPRARKALVAYPWPGNVRELGNVVERALVLGDGEVIRLEDLPPEVIEGSAEIPSQFQVALAETKKKLILDAWRQSGGDYAGAADLLGVHVNSLHRMIRRLGIKESLER